MFVRSYWRVVEEGHGGWGDSGFICPKGRGGLNEMCDARVSGGSAGGGHLLASAAAFVRHTE